MRNIGRYIKLNENCWDKESGNMINLIKYANKSIVFVLSSVTKKHVIKCNANAACSTKNRPFPHFF